MTAPTPPQPIRDRPCAKPDCRCVRDDEAVAIDAERLRKLRDGLRRNTTAVTRIIEQILAELEEGRRAA